MTHIYDISLPVRNGGFVYPGNPEIRIEPQQSIANGAGANVSSLAFGSHTGTHVDAAKHFFNAGQTVDQIPLSILMGPAILLAFDDELMSIGTADLEKQGIGSHTRVLLRTRNSALLSRPDFVRNYTYLTPDGAAHLASRGVRLIGVDYLSIEQFRSGHHRTHRTLLEQGIVIVEGLDLSQPPPGEYDFACLPLKLEGLDGAPARAVLVATDN